MKTWAQICLKTRKTEIICIFCLFAGRVLYANRAGRKGVRAGRKTVRAGRSTLRSMPSWNAAVSAQRSLQGRRVCTYWARGAWSRRRGCGGRPYDLACRGGSRWRQTCRSGWADRSRTAPDRTCTNLPTRTTPRRYRATKYSCKLLASPISITIHIARSYDI